MGMQRTFVYPKKWAVDSGQYVNCFSTKLLPEVYVDVLKHVAVLTLYKILLIYIYICCACVGLDNTRYIHQNIG